MQLTNARAVDYEDPALEGQNITLICAPGQVLNGSNQSTCMGSGKWEPNPGEVECMGEQFDPVLLLFCACLCDDLVILNIQLCSQQIVCLRRLVLDK